MTGNGNSGLFPSFPQKMEAVHTVLLVTDFHRRNFVIKVKTSPFLVW